MTDGSPTDVDAGTGARWERPAWSITEHVQAIVDALGAELDRSIVVEDRRMRLIAFSPHRGKFDAIRERSVLTRETPVQAVRWLSELGVFESTAPVRVAGHPQIGAAARLMTTIRWQGGLIGFLAVLDPEASLDEAQLERCRVTSERLAGLLQRMLVLQQGDRPRERRLVDALLGGAGSDARTRAGAALVEEGHLRAGRSLGVVVVEPREAAGATVAVEDEVLLSQIVARAQQSGPPGRLAATTRPGRVAFVAVLDSGDGGDAAGPARRVHAALATLPEPYGAGRAALVTYGNAVEDPADAARAHDQATLTARVAHRVRGLGPVVGWAELGIYQALALIAEDQLGGTDADARLTLLLDKPDLVLTLETYLELGADAKHSAEVLNLHRASLYYRLNRIEEVLGVNLKRGEDRLSMHVALKTLRLRGGWLPLTAAPESDLTRGE